MEGKKCLEGVAGLRKIAKMPRDQRSRKSPSLSGVSKKLHAEEHLLETGEIPEGVKRS